MDARVTGKRQSGFLRMAALAALWTAAAAAAAAAGDAPAAPGAWREQVRRFSEEHFKNPAWGYSHCQRDYALARELAAADHVTLDDDVL